MAATWQQLAAPPTPARRPRRLCVASRQRVGYPAGVTLSLQCRWFLGLAALLAGLLFAINLAVELALPRYLHERIRADLHRNAALARAAFAPRLAEHPPPTALLNALAHELARQTGLRVTVLTADGTVVAESDLAPADLARVENHFHRPEIQQALHAGAGDARRRSSTVDEEMLYAAATVRGAPPTQPLLGFVRLATPLTGIRQTTGYIRRTLAATSALVMALALPAAYWLARRFSRPIETMRQMATRVAEGDLAARAPELSAGQLGELGRALNQMAQQLENRLLELAEEKAELNATLSNMIEGVLVVDAAGKIRIINRALQRQLNLPDSARNKTVIEAFLSPPLQDLVAQALAGRQPGPREITFYADEERVFDVNAAALRAREGAGAGAVVVFHDITRVKQLENIRTEFVANVSHELRTPLSIIKGYVETLLDELPPDRPTARQFLETIQRHSRRLETLIEDLLTISALESQQARLQCAPVALRPVAAGVIEELDGQAREKSIVINLEIPDDIPPVTADAQRLHQVFFNLLDNAVKYIPPAGRVTVSARPRNGEIEVCVADDGPGIALEHLSRIFERFYRVDHARSPGAERRGTGLGLSIVKHIVQAHGGRVWAESQPGHGSAFYFTLPRA
jgi:two-component system phosphate regulon sensor histidine kinase PhoR